MASYTYPKYVYVPPPELVLKPGGPQTVPVLIVGAGPVGLTLALDLALKGIPVTVLDEDDTVSVGSRSICQAQRTLEIWHRLGVADRMVAKGVTWDEGEVLLGDRPLYRFNLQPEPGHRFPAFINLQQYYCEQYLVERCLQEDKVDLRFLSRLVGVRPDREHVEVDIQTPDGTYQLRGQWLVACDGVRSPVRTMLGLPYEGEVFDDQFLIADIRMTADLPKIRRYWFYPPFHPTDSVLLHRQADNVLRVDFQLGRDADAEEERKPANIDRRLRMMFGPDARWEHEWSSVYKFSCRAMPRFVHGRVIFAGDAAHVVSPFGARGGNSGVEDADNLGWKLALLLNGHASASLLASYDKERGAAARENIRQSTRSTDYITPKFPAARLLRDASLSLARDFAFARAMVNSGRLSRPTPYADSPISTPDDIIATWDVAAPAPGMPLPDAPLGEGWLTELVAGRFAVLVFAERAASLDAAEARRVADMADEIPGFVPILVTRDRLGAPNGWTTAIDKAGLAARRCDAQDGTTYLIRPDQYVAGRWRKLHDSTIWSALKRATS
ncbi:MAG: FAD-dependent oxidoreductase [Alphaproteobacteria bacterium]|nr:FAD-dependent oxidoreductase [Alphaproteobacteria bacterium]MCW5742328.1 FAD-dependent oxidoreductase [Alphaproteobacteria bacterium]